MTNLQMIYNDSFETCERTVVELRIYSDTLTPTELSSRLGLHSTSSLAKGEVRTSSTGGRQRVGRINSWILSSEEHVVSRDARRHLDWLIDQIQPAKFALLALQGTEQATTYVSCVWWSAHGHGGPRFWPQQLHALGEHGLELEIDFAFYGVESNE